MLCALTLRSLVLTRVPGPEVDGGAAAEADCAGGGARGEGLVPHQCRSPRAGDVRGAGKLQRGEDQLDADDSTDSRHHVSVSWGVCRRDPVEISTKHLLTCLTPSLSPPHQPPPLSVLVQGLNLIHQHSSPPPPIDAEFLPCLLFASDSSTSNLAILTLPLKV